MLIIASLAAMFSLSFIPYVVFYLLFYKGLLTLSLGVKIEWLPE